MYAKRLLETISPKMNKAQMMDLINRAINDLEFMDKHDLAKITGLKPVTIRKWAVKHDIGIKMRGQRIFNPSDIKKFNSRSDDNV